MGVRRVTLDVLSALLALPELLTGWKESPSSSAYVREMMQVWKLGTKTIFFELLRFIGDYDQVDGASSSPSDLTGSETGTRTFAV